jgi:hypothetical protein
MLRNLGQESTPLVRREDAPALGFRFLRYFADRESAAALVQQLSGLPNRQQFLITGEPPRVKVWHKAVEDSW